ncbi:hypothetical protein HYFRA_00007483 [Hymenoscyphus fraxineus]|uniref:Carboxypeptidase Y inhibitor n=1 Tax=Hymenoscyphus fraxineus TaxID=746836 RepID=A0A9N9KU40_9HELO|nr:hypothetical protein HYFRA_00007483 [Hymenoscyphus fraxineus]
MRFLSLSSILLLLISPSIAIENEQQQKVFFPFPIDLGFKFIRKELKKAQIITQVLDDFLPKCHVLPSYPHHPVHLGNELKNATTQSRPKVRIFCPHLKRRDIKGLTIALTDPDAPSRENPKWGEMCHWIGIVTLGKGKEGVLDVEVGEGVEDELVEYKPPGPPEKTGYHRYIFVLLEGETGNLTAPSERQHWGTGKERHGIRDWASKEGLKVIGANYFVEENEKQ